MQQQRQQYSQSNKWNKTKTNEIFTFGCMATTAAAAAATAIYVVFV